MSNRNRKAVFTRSIWPGQMGSSSVIFHSVVAEKFGLTVTDWRAWDIVSRHGRFTAPGSFAEWTGLTPGAVTGLIDRLVEAAAVERVSDPQDRRKVLVRAIARPSDPTDRRVAVHPVAGGHREAIREVYR